VYELEDTVCNGGGFCCLPGSHKSNVALPPRYMDLSKRIDRAVHRVPAAAGDCIIFTEGLTHGTLM
jgi:ectoine hydroxylase-related dioxygenase (phytanoyl-CoA dioxygenase family)